MTIASKYFEDFLDPTLLLWGEVSDLRELSHVLRNLDINSSRTITSPKDGYPVTLTLSEHTLGLRKLPSGFVWHLSKSVASHFADLIDVLETSPHGHQYLECPDDKIVVMVSFNEYPADLS